MTPHGQKTKPQLSSKSWLLFSLRFSFSVCLTHFRLLSLTSSFDLQSGETLRVRPRGKRRSQDDGRDNVPIHCAPAGNGNGAPYRQRGDASRKKDTSF